MQANAITAATLGIGHQNAARRKAMNGGSTAQPAIKGERTTEKGTQAEKEEKVTIKERDKEKTEKGKEKAL